MKKFHNLFKFISARRSKLADAHTEPEIADQPYRYNTCPEDREDGAPGRRGVEREATDAAKRLWCSAEHF